MTADQIHSLIQWSIGVITPVTGGTIALKSWITSQLEKEKIRSAERVAVAKENSAGAEAIMDLMRKNDQIQDDFRELEKKVNTNKEDIRSLAREIKDYTFQVLQLFKK